ncbi:MAG: cytidylate kinase-like family protein [Chloroflexi bacterium]|nr:cytidylate kinase-like family protein [Chloroflexota bacterium]
MPIVTVSRQYASGGGPIAELVAQRLGAVLLDRELIHEVAVRLGLPEEVVSEHDERGESVVARLVGALRLSYPDASAPPDLLDQPGDVPDLSNRAYVQVIEQVIQEAARQEDVVIAGRGSQFVLRNHPRALHVHVYKAFDQRVQAVMAEQETGRSDAERLVRDYDAARGRYARHFYHADWRAAEHYHLLINSGSFEREVAADLIVAAARSRG